MNILVVINDAFFSNKIKSIICEQDNDNNYIFLDSYSDAVEYLDNTEIKILITDAKINEHSGIELLEYARMTTEKIIKIVIADEKSLDILLEMINTEGIFKFILKPIHMVQEIMSPLYAAIEKAREIENADIIKLNNMNDNINYSRVINQVMPRIKHQDTSLLSWLRISELLFESNVRKKDLYLNKDNYSNYYRFFKNTLEKYFNIFLENESTLNDYLNEIIKEFHCRVKAERDIEIQNVSKLYCAFILSVILDFINIIIPDSECNVYLLKHDDKYLLEINRPLEDIDFKSLLINNAEVFELFKMIVKQNTSDVKMSYKDNFLKIKAMI